MISVVTRIRRALRTARATAAAIGTTVASMAKGGADTGIVQLRRGDRAPDFTLPGSDGTTYRLADLVGHGETIVIAWFPKAFTGG